MKHLNLELQKLEDRTAPGLLPAVPIIGGGGGGDSYSNGSKSNSNGSKSGGSKSS